MTNIINKPLPIEWDGDENILIEKYVDLFVRYMPLSNHFYIEPYLIPNLTQNQQWQFVHLNHKIRERLTAYGYIENLTVLISQATILGREARCKGGHHEFQAELKKESKLKSTKLKLEIVGFFVDFLTLCILIFQVFSSLM